MLKVFVGAVFQGCPQGNPKWSVWLRSHTLKAMGRVVFAVQRNNGKRCQEVQLISEIQLRTPFVGMVEEGNNEREGGNKKKQCAKITIQASSSTPDLHIIGYLPGPILPIRAEYYPVAQTEWEGLFSEPYSPVLDHMDINRLTKKERWIRRRIPSLWPVWGVGWLITPGELWLSTEFIHSSDGRHPTITCSLVERERGRELKAAPIFGAMVDSLFISPTELRDNELCSLLYIHVMRNVKNFHCWCLLQCDLMFDLSFLPIQTLNWERTPVNLH